ncbi:MAG: hypothetical protein OXU23_13695 [Candidatus Poribacteria bacterium]|nr:hypothetical protein [Candidatus Poribacteria bacterium]
MNLPTDFPELDELKEKMDAQTEPEIDMRLRVVGVDVTQENFKIEDEIPIVQNRKVVLYLREPKDFHKYRELPKYHIRHCEKIKEMKINDEYYRYTASTRMDGNFLLKLSTNGELSLEKLVLCKLCLYELRSPDKWNVFDPDPEKFPLEDWFEPFSYSSENWKERSLTCRESANWTCQKCNINLESHQHLLHAHHKWGTRYNDPDDLTALCIGCHSKKRGGGHQMLKYYPDYDEFIAKYGEKWNAYHQPF